MYLEENGILNFEGGIYREDSDAAALCKAHHLI